MLDLQAINHRSQLAEDLIRPLVVLELRGNQVGQISQRFRGIKDLVISMRKLADQCRTHILHNANSLFSLADKLILRLLNLGTSFLTQAIQIALRSRLLAGLDRVQHKPGILDILARLSRKHQVRVKRRVPPSQEPRLDLRILRQPRLADLLRCKGVLLQRGRQRVLAAARRRVLRQSLGPGQRGPGNSVTEGLGLRLCGGRRGQGRLGICGGRRLREKLDFLVDGAAHVVEGLADVGRVVVGLIGVLGADSHQQAGLLEPQEVTHVTCSSFWCTVFSASTRFSSSRYSSGSWVLSSAWPSCSLINCCVRVAKGVKFALSVRAMQSKHVSKS